MIELGKFKFHIPKEITDRNAYAAKLADLLDGMGDIKKEQINRFEDSFDPRLSEISELKKRVDSFGGEYPNSATRKTLECLYFHKWDIYAQKGSRKGFEQWLTCVCGGTLNQVVYTPGYHLIHFQTIQAGMLPEGQQIAAEENGTGQKNPRLLEGSWNLNYGQVLVEVTGATDTSQLFKDWLIKQIPNYLPMTDPNTVTITLNLT